LNIIVDDKNAVHALQNGTVPPTRS
jgi:hypothetical protein